MNLSTQPFLQQILIDEWDRVGGAFQQFLADNQLSSHMWACCAQERMNFFMDKHQPPSESKRLEALWSGEFGDAYVERNRAAGNIREPFWQKVLTEFAAQTVLEVGCNIGATCAG